MRVNVDRYLEEEGLPQCPSCGSRVMDFDWERGLPKCQDCGAYEEEVYVKKKNLRLPPKKIKRLDWEDE
tara:strand:+ start:135 stop:341 length:207 start_codon:yes stop_codon:yes gene_type:complete